MLRDLHKDHFKPRIFLAMLAAILGWGLLVPCYFIFAGLVDITKNMAFLTDSGLEWFVLLLSGVPFWFLFNWILRFSNIKRMPRIPCIAATGVVVLWSTLPAILIALAVWKIYMDGHPSQNVGNQMVPDITAWAAGAIVFGLCHMPEKPEER